jgi:hypothetical protein
MSNSLARVCTPLFFPNSERLKRPGCLAIHLDFKKSNRDFDKFELTKINFSSKREISETQIRLLKILKYCFGVEEPFLDNYVKNYLKSKLSTIIKPKIVQDCSNANKYIEDLEFLNDMKNNLAQKEIVEIAENNLKLSKDLHYLMIICSDLIVLPDIFKRYFIKHENFESILNPIHSNIHNIHPDALVACEIFKDSYLENRYIGATFLCWILCSIYLDCHLFEFRGTSGEYEKTTWQTPPKINDNFIDAINNLSLLIQNTSPPFTATFKNNHQVDSCKRTQGKMADDIKQYIKYYAQLREIYDCDIYKILLQFESILNKIIINKD